VQLIKNSPDSLLASFVSAKTIKPGLMLIAGPSGSGKTRWCMDLIERAHAIGYQPKGLVSPAVFEGGQKVGIDLLDLSSGSRRRLAYRRGEPTGDVQTADWQLDAETLEWGNSILERLNSCDLFILDEIGPLEFDHNVGLVAGLGLLDARRDFLACVTIRPSLLPVAKKRWPWADEVDLLSREAR
jgi:nucleoside-triphosphatase THEP1